MPFQAKKLILRLGDRVFQLTETDRLEISSGDPALNGRGTPGPDVVEKLLQRARVDPRLVGVAWAALIAPEVVVFETDDGHVCKTTRQALPVTRPFGPVEDATPSEAQAGRDAVDLDAGKRLMGVDFAMAVEDLTVADVTANASHVFG